MAVDRALHETKRRTIDAEPADGTRRQRGRHSRGRQEFSEPTKRPESPKRGRAGFVREIAIFYGFGVAVAIAVCILWLAGDVLLLAFASVLLAILLSDASRRLQSWLPLSGDLALGLIVVVSIGALGLLGWLVAPDIAEQSHQLVQALTRALQRLQAWIQRFGATNNLPPGLPAPDAVASQASSMIARAGGFFTGVVGGVASVVIIVFVGIYLAARPAMYVNGFITLVPQRKRQRAREVAHELGNVLGQWLMGKLLSMLIVGVLTAAGLALIGAPLALVLGLLAGLLDFIPYIGPLLAGVPAVLIAFSESPTLALYVLLLFVAVQTVEGYLILPLIERRTVSLPPAVTILMQTLLGAFFGLGGVALATPLTAVLAVLVTMLYVQDVLGDPVSIPGENGTGDSRAESG